MSVQIRQQVTRKWAWIPRVSVVIAAGLALGLAGASQAAPTPARAESQVRAITDWEAWILFLLELLINELSCPSLQLPPDVPLAMEVTVDCYNTGGLSPMTLEERLAFLAVLNEAEEACKQAPPNFPENTLKAFVDAIAAMRQDAQAVP